MSAVQHTPGPWRLTTYKITEGKRVISYGWSIVDAKSRSVPFHSIDGSKEALANARLIAAAPELLDALRALHRVCMAMNLEADHERPTEEAYLQATAHAGAAIAKATGAQA